jgi:hypothetical protein
MTTDSPEMSALKHHLSGFIGTECYHQLSLVPIRCTDGVYALAERAQAYWLVDVIASYQLDPKFRKMPFQVWEISVDANKYAVVLMRQDSGKKPEVEQVVPYTSFPAGKFEFFLQHGVLMLPSEY